MKRVTCKMGKKKEKLDDEQLLLTVTDEKHTRPLVREGAPQRQNSKFQTEIISSRKYHSGLETN
jgi:hypothetical protein